MDKHLQGWVITANSYKNVWVATTRDHYHELWSDSQSENIISSKELDSLQTIIIKCKGDLEEVKKWKEVFDGEHS